MSAGTPQPRSAGAHHQAWRSRSAWATLIIVAVLGIVADIATKYWAFRNVGPHPVEIRREDVLTTRPLGLLIPPDSTTVVIKDWLNFELVLNPGAVFGIGAGKRLFFVAFTLAAIALGVAMFAKWTGPRDHSAHVGIGLVLAGGVGNLYDRLVYACVRDFIHPVPGFKLPFGWTWPSGDRGLWPWVSNVADLFLIIGVVLLLVYSLRPPGAHPKPATTRTPAESTP